MAFIVRNPDPIHCQWVPVAANVAGSGTATTIYEGQIVQMGFDGVVTLGAASGVWNTSNKAGYGSGSFATNGIPYGVVLGTARRYELYDTTYMTQKITSMITSNANYYPAGTEMAGIEGGWGNDLQAYAYVHRITPDTILSGPVCFTALGTAPTVATVLNLTTGGATGMGYTTAASIGFTPVSGLTTAYFRSGLNMGINRTLNSTSTTAVTVLSPFPKAVTVGDTAVHVNVKNAGHSAMQLDALALCVLGDAANAYNGSMYSIDVIRLNLKEAGREYVDFKFGLYNFLPALT